MSTLLFEGRADLYGIDGCLMSEMETPANLAMIVPLGEITHTSGDLDDPSILWFRTERGAQMSIDLTQTTDYVIVD